MQLLKHTHMRQIRLTGWVLVCCLLSMLCFGRSSCVQPLTSTSAFAAVYSQATNNTSSTADRPLLAAKGHCHISSRSRVSLKLPMNDSPGILKLARLQIVQIIAASTLFHNSVIALPGYYLFLFRYALF